ncbi:MAG: non-ribosomal peptide synthetase [Pyrinomonadaceae bacterium]
MKNNKGGSAGAQLTPAQRELLARLLEEEGIQTAACGRVRRRGPDEALQLSFAQQRLWLLDQLEPGNIAYKISRLFRLTGPLNVHALEGALGEIVRRHESLRTTFTVKDGRPLQIIADFSPLVLRVTDLAGLEAESREDEMWRLAAEEVARPFDLARGPLFRTGLLRLADDDHALLITMHHIISDGWSLMVFNRELCELYQAFSQGRPSPLEELPVQYADFALWQREQLAGETLEQQLSYWRQQLAGLPPVLQLPLDHQRPTAQTYAGKHLSFELDADLTNALKEVSREEQCTLYMTMLAAFAVLLSRYTHETDIPIGSPIAGRNQLELERLIGFFVSTLVLRVDCGGDPSFRQLMQRVRESCLGAYAHQDVPFEKLVEEIEPERSLSHSPLFQVMFALQNLPWDGLQLGELELKQSEVDSSSSKFDLSLVLKETPTSLDGMVTYNSDLFVPETIQRLYGHWRTLLEGIVSRPESRLSELPMLTPPEMQQLLVEWNQTAAQHPRGQCLHQTFEAQAARTPDAVAVVFEDRPVSYGELNSRANRLAHRLLALGVRPEERVGILLERSTEMVVALLAVLKAGGAYVPLDAAYPRQRLAFMLEDAAVKVLVTERQFADDLPAETCVCLDDEYEALARVPELNPEGSVSPEHLAYVIYTSGSTGRPKGVAIEHRNAVTLLNWAAEQFTEEELAGVLASTSICFDLSVFEIFAPLSRGGTVILVKNILSLQELTSTRPVRLINTVPSAMNELLRLKAVPAPVRTVNLAGEALPGKLVQQIYEETGAQRVWNLYGPSEDTTYSTAALIERGSSRKPPIGRPISETQAYILDRHYRPVPVGVSGELFLGGAGLARCYLHRPALTAERFVPDPFGDRPGARLYRTGDVARYLPGGEIDYLGRFDHQVKLNGYRIELGEIEAALSRHEAIAESVVIVNEAGEDKRLVAYLVASEAGRVLTAELRQHLQQHLPHYMVPQLFVWLAELPLTANGKLDRQALPEPEAEREIAEERRPPTPVEEVVAAIWANVLHLERVGLNENFFELGGHSLLGMQVISRLKEMLQVELPLRKLFEFPTVELLSQQLVAREAKPGQTEKIAKVVYLVMSRP